MVCTSFVILLKKGGFGNCLLKVDDYTFAGLYSTILGYLLYLM